MKISAIDYAFNLLTGTNPLDGVMRKLVQAIPALPADALSQRCKELAAAPGFEKKHRDSLLYAAIRTDDVDIFTSVMGAVLPEPDPHYLISAKTKKVILGAIEYHLPFLSAAIDAGSKALAVIFANDPATDVTLRGRLVCHNIGLPTNDNEYKTPLELAREAGMQDVVDIVLERRSENIGRPAQRRDITLG